MDRSAAPTSLIADLRTMVRLAGYALRLAWRSSPPFVVAIFLLMAAQSATTIAAIYFTKLSVDALGAQLSIAPSRGLSQATWFVGAAVGATVAGILCQTLLRLVREAHAELAADHVHDIIHAQSAAIDLQYYENSQYHDTLHRAQLQAAARPTRILNNLLDALHSGIGVTALSALLLTVNAAFGAMLILAAVPEVLSRLKHAARFYRWDRANTARERLAKYYAWILTLATHAKEVRLLGIGPLCIDRFRELRAQIRRERLRLARARSLTEFATQGAATLMVFLAFVLVVHRLSDRELTAGDLVMYLQAFQQGYGQVRRCMASLSALYEDGLYLSDLREFLDLPSIVQEASNPVDVPQPLRQGIAFQQVSFRYSNGITNALEDVSLTIGAGECVALVGENGAGKTTLIKLLCRFYDPGAGVITCDGVDLRQLQISAWRQSMSVFLQDFVRYDLTARENIRFGDVGIRLDDSGIVQAAQQTGADPFLSELKHGYDTVLGKLFDGAQDLSNGQWQRLALARALVRNAPLVVLDEPNSFLDPDAEFAFLEALLKFVKGRTSIIVSHRLATVRSVDRIYVMRQGRIVEHGTHDELMAQGREYWRMFERQARAYR